MGSRSIQYFVLGCEDDDDDDDDEEEEEEEVWIDAIPLGGAPATSLLTFVF